MRRAHWLAAVTLLCGIVSIVAACSSDDGATTRQSGSVRLIGPEPEGGGGSVSAVGAGCTTRGASTKIPATSVEVGLDEWSVQPPAAVAPGVVRFVVKNFGSEAHELLIVQANALSELPRAGDEVDEAAITGVPKFKIEAFPSNTICEGTFELPAGSYLLLDNQPGAADKGMVGALVVG